jgi:hypothetical protein
LRRGIRPTEYAQHILDIAYKSIRNYAFQGSFLAEGRKKTLEKRIIHALHFNRGKIIKTGGIKMKTTRLVLVCVMVVTVIAVVGSCASTRKTITEEDFVTIWSGTWANRGLVGDNFYPQILINHPDGTMEFFRKPVHMTTGSKEIRKIIWGAPSITDMWIDRDGKIWFTAATERTTERGTVMSYYGFIHESGDVLEIIETEGTQVLDEWDPAKWLWYHHRIYYRQ